MQTIVEPAFGPLGDFLVRPRNQGIMKTHPLDHWVVCDACDQKGDGFLTNGTNLEKEGFGV